MCVKRDINWKPAQLDSFVSEPAAPVQITGEEENPLESSRLGKANNANDRAAPAPLLL